MTSHSEFDDADYESAVDELHDPHDDDDFMIAIEREERRDADFALELLIEAQVEERNRR